MIDNRQFDRHGNLFVAIVSYDYDYGWTCEEWHDGEYEENACAEYGHEESGRLAALADGLMLVNQRRDGRLLHFYESPETVQRKRAGYASLCATDDDGENWDNE